MSAGTPIRWQVEAAGDHLLLSFEIPESRLDPAELAEATVPDNLDTRAGVVISGRGPQWLYAHLSLRLHEHPWIAAVDANKNRAVVVRAAGVNCPRVGEILVGPGFVPVEMEPSPRDRGGPRGPAVALLGLPHRGKSVLAGALYDALLDYRDREWYVLRVRADGEGQWTTRTEGNLARALRMKRIWTNAGMERMATEIAALRAARRFTIVDLPGKADEITARLLRECSHALILVDSGDAATQETQRWTNLCDSCGVAVLGVLRTSPNDIPLSLRHDRVLEGTLGGVRRHASLAPETARGILDGCLTYLGLQLTARRAS